MTQKSSAFCATTRCIGIICLSDKREFIILIYAGPLTHAAIKYLAAFRLNGGGREERRRRVPQTRPERSKSRMHLSTILVPLSPGPYGISRSVGSNGSDGERAGHRRGGRKRTRKRREGRKAKVRAGRRKRPRQDVGSCLPAGG